MKGGIIMFNVSDSIMQMIFITIDEKETETANKPELTEREYIETACTGCHSGCVGSCLNACSGSGKGSTGTGW